MSDFQQTDTKKKLTMLITPFILYLIQNCLVPSLSQSYRKTKSASPSSARLFCYLLVSIS